jgi:hypothetical protein
LKNIRNSAVFLQLNLPGIPCVFAHGIPQVTTVNDPDSKFPLELKKKLLNKLYCISIFNAKKLVKDYSSEGLQLQYFYILYAILCAVVVWRKVRRYRNM